MSNLSDEDQPVDGNQTFITSTPKKRDISDIEKENIELRARLAQRDAAARKPPTTLALAQTNVPTYKGPSLDYRSSNVETHIRDIEDQLKKFPDAPPQKLVAYMKESMSDAAKSWSSDFWLNDGPHLTPSLVFAHWRSESARCPNNPVNCPVLWSLKFCEDQDKMKMNNWNWAALSTRLATETVRTVPESRSRIYDKAVHMLVGSASTKSSSPEMQDAPKTVMALKLQELVKISPDSDINWENIFLQLKHAMAELKYDPYNHIDREGVSTDKRSEAQNKRQKQQQQPQRNPNPYPDKRAPTNPRKSWDQTKN